MSSTTRKIVFTENAAKPGGPYSQAVIIGNTMFISGQVGRDLAGNMAPGGALGEAEQCMKNMKAILNAAGADMNNVVKTTLLLQDINDLAAINNVYAKFFPQNQPTRMAYQPKDLPKGCLVEMEAVAIIGEIKDEPFC